jgi:tetratricopeptide (TPR) repeat protein
MRKFIIIISVFILISNGYTYAAAEEVSETANLKKAADDMKFANAISFYKLEKYDRALNEFYEYIEIYYDGIHRNEAFRKIAEIHIRSFNYQKAIEAYNSITRNSAVQMKDWMHIFKPVYVTRKWVLMRKRIYF